MTVKIKESVYEEIYSARCEEGLTDEQEAIVANAFEALKDYLPFLSFNYYVRGDTVELSYTRYETDEEEQVRIQRVEDAEYKQYLELKNKFENKGK